MIYENIFTVRRYMLVRYMAPSCVCVCVCVCACLLHSGIVSKWLYVGSHDRGSFSNVKDHSKIRTGPPLTGATNACGVLKLATFDK